MVILPAYAKTSWRNSISVAEQRASYLFGKSPKMCGRKIYVICLVQLFRQSSFTRSC
jgi:hypothetical protein